MITRKKILITVKAYPLPSRSYGELVCTAGVDVNGEWTRVYPVPLAYLNSQEFAKYKWIELNLVRRDKGKDFRPESYKPANLDLSDMLVVGSIGTENNWAERKKYCLKEVYTSLNKLWLDSRAPKNKSLTTFKPASIVGFVYEDEEREWKQKWQEEWKQTNLFSFRGDDGAREREMIRKLPYKFSYEIRDDDGVVSKMMIEDWEIGALYWNCLKGAEGDEGVALEKVKQKYFTEFSTSREVYLFLGTTQKFHAMRVKNPFVIVGVFYPSVAVVSQQIELGM